MAYAPVNVEIEKINGEFRETEFKNRYEYTSDPQYLTQWDINHGATHRVFVATLGETRPAIIKKTVVHVMTDENVWEKWNVKRIWHRN